MTKKDNEIITIDAPVLDQSAHTETMYRSGVIYSINLDNGIVITSPESFESFSLAEIQQRHKLP